MALTAVDHFLALLILVALPIYGYLSFPRVKRRLAEDKPGVRVRLYRRTMIWQWTLASITVGAWLMAGRPLVALGLTWPGTTSTWLMAGTVAAIIGFMLTQLRALPKHADMHPELREQLDSMAPFLPRNGTESTWFSGVAVTAGVCEEVLYRGFCLAYVGAWVGPWAAVAVTSVMFGLGHLYQGRRGALKTGVAGFIAGTIYVVSGTLWLPILLHVFVDLHGGMVYRVVRRSTAQG